MLSVLLMVSLLSDMLSCGPPLHPKALHEFQHHAKGITPMLQTAVHIPENEDFERKKETLQRFVQGWDIYPCKLTNKFDETTSQCFGFLRLALVEHDTLQKMARLPQVQHLNKLKPLWIENERDVVSYLRTQLQSYSAQFTSQLWQDEVALEDFKDQKSAQYVMLEKRVRARMLMEYWVEVSNIVEKIFVLVKDRRDSFADEHFSTIEDFQAWVQEQAEMHHAYFGWDQKFSTREFLALVDSYFITQPGFYSMIREELEYRTQIKLMGALKPQLRSFKSPFSMIEPTKARAASVTATMSQHKLRRKFKKYL